MHVHKQIHLKARLHLLGGDATTCPVALSTRQTMQKNRQGITLRTTGQAVQLINPG